MAMNAALAISTTGQAGIQVTENEALIESSFRRLLASIEAEREKIRSTWQQIEAESGATADELERLRQDTEAWCHSERNKTEIEWKRLDKLRERMSILWPVSKGDTLEINCSGKLFSLPKSALCSVEGSMLNHMFSDAFVQSIPRDAHGRFFLDFNPHCFGIILQFLEARAARADAPVPSIPPEQQQNMDLLVEALKLKPFLRENCLMASHGTSLKVLSNTVAATHSGWQVISAQYPMRMSGNAYFEVSVLANPDARAGGLAVGVIGHIPQGPDVYSICLPDAVVYNSGKGLVGEMAAVDNVTKGLKLSEGTVLGIKHDIYTRSLHWYHNGISIGACSLEKEGLERMRVLYPMFALMTPEQKIQVDFSATNPRAMRETDAAPLSV
mmetsp:Transcript_79959/g.226219  ORF Transcript_79959/g.226219 Transcript_79959/m.226219 type:complete len:385 (+) Transcript_79959:52-1206(+)